MMFAVVVCFCAGVIVGLPALRLQGTYLALVTLAVGILFPMVPAWAGGQTLTRGVAVLARGHRAVDGLRRLGRDVALVATDQLAFGDSVPASYVDFVGPDLKQGVALVILMGVLMIRPTGLFGTKKVERV